MKHNVQSGYFTAEYFKKTRQIIKEKFPNNIVTLQFFQRQDNSILCGITEVLKLLKEVTNTKEYKISYLNDGQKIKAFEPVLVLEGPYHSFGFLEGIIDGILARQTSIATNANKIINVANSTPIIAMTDRADHYSMLESDGYALSIGGITSFVTDASSSYSKSKAIGTMPHALIGMFSGNTLEATKYFHKIYPNEDLVALVDFNNDVINETLKIAKYFKKTLKMVRVDTSSNMSDKYFKQNEEYGVTVNLIKALRKSLDDNGYKWVKIIVSSGFNEEKIREFVKNNAPVDYFGVGKSLLVINNEFTGDAVLMDGKPIGKTGRQLIINPKLIKY